MSKSELERPRNWRLAGRRGVSNFTITNTSTRGRLSATVGKTGGGGGGEGEKYSTFLVVALVFSAAPHPAFSYAPFTIVKRRATASGAGYVFREAKTDR